MSSTIKKKKKEDKPVDLSKTSIGSRGNDSTMTNSFDQNLTRGSVSHDF